MDIDKTFLLWTNIAISQIQEKIIQDWELGTPLWYGCINKTGAVMIKNIKMIKNLMITNLNFSQVSFGDANLIMITAVAINETINSIACTSSAILLKPNKLCERRTPAMKINRDCHYSSL